MVLAAVVNGTVGCPLEDRFSNVQIQVGWYGTRQSSSYPVHFKVDQAQLVYIVPGQSTFISSTSYPSIFLMVSLRFRTLAQFFYLKPNSTVIPDKDSETLHQEAKEYAAVVKDDDLMRFIDCLDQVCH